MLNILINLKVISFVSNKLLFLYYKNSIFIFCLSLKTKYIYKSINSNDKHTQKQQQQQKF